MQVLATIDRENLGTLSGRSADLSEYTVLCTEMIQGGKGKRIGLSDTENKQTFVNRLNKAAKALNADVKVFSGAKMFNVLVYVPSEPTDGIPTVHA